VRDYEKKKIRKRKKRKNQYIFAIAQKKLLNSL